MIYLSLLTCVFEKSRGSRKVTSWRRGRRRRRRRGRERHDN